jgi:hypothetical protein
MSIKRAIQSTAVPRPQIKNLTYFNPSHGVIGMAKDRATFYGALNQVLAFSTNADTNTSPTWTTIFTFPSLQGQVVSSILELPNGEALVVCTQVGQNPNRSRLYKSSGWNFGVGKLTATWTETLLTTGGTIIAEYAMHGFNVGKNGTVVVAEGGSQTVGGSGNEAADVNKARRVWVSKDFGATWSQIFDVYTYGQSQGVAYPAGMHVHGVAYDEDWDAIWVCYGDNTGDSKTVAGSGYTSVVYSYDDGVTWNKLPTPERWSNAGQLAATLQFIQPIVLKQSVIFTPDLTEPLAPFMYPKLGYRRLGPPKMLSKMSSAVGFPVRKSDRDAKLPMFFGGVIFGTQTGTVTVPLIITEDDGFTWSRFTEDVPLQSPALTGWGYNEVFGPSINGKLVMRTRHSINNTAANRHVQADYYSADDARQASGGVITIANGGVIPHGLFSTPSRVTAIQTVANRAIAITAVDATNITISLTDLAGAVISTPEPVRWTAAV